MDEIEAAHAAGHDVARVHSGDPSIYGAVTRFTLDGAGSFDGDGLFKLSADGDAVRTEDRDAHAGHGRTELVVVHDLATLVFHLHLFLRVAGVEKRIDLRDGVEGDLVRIDVWLAVELGRVPGAVLRCPFAGLVGEFLNGLDRKSVV